jgi:hypothetical protein
MNMHIAPSLFDWTPPERAAAIEIVAQHADENHSGWTEEARAHVRSYAATHREFISEDCSDAAYAAGLMVPHDARAWGKVYRAEAKAGSICKAGYGHSKKRASPTVLWRSCHSNFARSA